MNDTALLALALVASITGMALFALSMKAHWEQVAGKRSHPRVVRIGLRMVGAALLTFAFHLCTLADPLSMAALVWPMLLAVAAAVVATALTIHARILVSVRRAS